MSTPFGDRMTMRYMPVLPTMPQFLCVQCLIEVDATTSVLRVVQKPGTIAHRPTQFVAISRLKSHINDLIDPPAEEGEYDEWS